MGGLNGRGRGRSRSSQIRDGALDGRRRSGHKLKNGRRRWRLFVNERNRFMGGTNRRGRRRDSGRGRRFGR